jgi:hypothetical protein
LLWCLIFCFHFRSQMLSWTFEVLLLMWDSCIHFSAAENRSPRVHLQVDIDVSLLSFTWICSVFVILSVVLLALFVLSICICSINWLASFPCSAVEKLHSWLISQFIQFLLTNTWIQINKISKIIVLECTNPHISISIFFGMNWRYSKSWIDQSTVLNYFNL